MAATPPRILLAGLGYFGRQQLAAWHGIEPGIVVAAADPDPAARAAAQAAFPGLRTGPDAARLIAAEAPDIVDVATPPDAHARVVRAALAPGRTIVCQKPLATGLGEARALVAKAEAAGATLLVHENFRFQPWHRTVKAMLDDGALGQVWRARFALRPGDGRGAQAYLARQPAFRTMPRFLIRETGLHLIDLFRWFFGEVTAVWADLRRLNPAIAGEDAGYMLLDHAGGAQSLFDGNRLSDHAAADRRRTMGEMEIEGEAGALRLDGDGALRFRRHGARRWRRLPLIAPVDDTAFGGGCIEALQRHLLAARAGEAPHASPARDYLRVMEIAEAAYRAAETGARQTMPPP